MSERTLVTGATGCLGSNLVARLLRDGSDVVALVPRGEPLGRLYPQRKHIEVRHGDVRERGDLLSAMRGVRRVYHVAGLAIPLNRFATPMWEVNVFGVHNTLSAARAAGVERVVHVSSTAAIGYPPHGVIATERFNPIDSVTDNAYATTKRHGEKIALSFNDSDLEVVVVNPSAVIAPGGDKRLGWGGVFEVARRGLLRFMPGGGSAFCSADDLVDGSVRAMERGRPGERYILSSQNLSYRELGKLVSFAVGVTPPWATLPRWLLKGVGVFNGLMQHLGGSSVFVPENVELMTRPLFYDQSKAVRELGMSQTPIAGAVDHVRDWIFSEVGHAGVQ